MVREFLERRPPDDSRRRALCLSSGFLVEDMKDTLNRRSMCFCQRPTRERFGDGIHESNDPLTVCRNDRITYGFKRCGVPRCLLFDLLLCPEKIDKDGNFRLDDLRL